MNPIVQIDKSIFQSGLILSPRHALHSWCSSPLQSIEAVPKQIDSHMVEQSIEPFLLPFCCCFRTLRNPWDMRFPVCVGDM